MSTKTSSKLKETLEKRKAIRNRVKKIKKTLMSLDTPFLDDAILKQEGIKQTTLDLEDESKNPGVMFCKRRPSDVPSAIPLKKSDDAYPGKRSPRAEARLIDITLNLTMNEHERLPEPWDVDGILNDKYFNLSPDLNIFAEVQAQSGTIPHSIVRIWQVIEATDASLVHNEVVCALTYMEYKSALVRYVEETVFPVLIISIFPYKARILQAYFDGEYLHIAKSKLYEFNDNIEETYTLFAEWSVPEHCGDVKTVQIEGEELSARALKQIERYEASASSSAKR